jgi:hypothetical protein
LPVRSGMSHYVSAGSSDCSFACVAGRYANGRLKVFGAELIYP